ncbi:MAG TPA: HlyD family efflux transporter periplasmic adaptor subunit [Pseudomonadales bacterium]|nr:HlyD family efflux transporter periplasmic adaptor subunit [Pseudomonadales bacterium]
MAKSLFSPLWYRVESIRPRLRSHSEIHRHFYRDEAWYVLQDKISGRYHRFSPGAYQLISQMDGKRTLQEIWESSVSTLGEDAPTQDEAIQLVGQLHAADLLATDVIPNSEELFERYRKHRQQKMKQRLMSPLAVRIPLFDPEKFLETFKFIVSPLFGWFGLVLWLLVVGYGLSLVGQHWNELTNNIIDTVLTPQNLFLIWLLFPVVKLAHEFGHGFATKVWGGEVHEMGIMFLVFMPVPYVDASASSAFSERYKRVIVGSAGMLVEVFIAAIAMIIWANAEPGVVRALAYNIILIAGVSTVLFNINPLLRFDGYYILSDILEMPNLAMKSAKYIGYLIQRYVFGVKELETPATARGESRWLVIYSFASFAYRATIMLAISIFVAVKFFFLGVLLAIWCVASVFAIPLIKHTAFIFTSPMLHRVRNRAVTSVVGTVVALVLVLFFFPAPLWTNAQGVVWLPDNAEVRAGSSCFVQQLLVKPGTLVKKGQPLISCENQTLRATYRVLLAKRQELEVKHVEELGKDRFKAAITAIELNTVKANLQRMDERVAELTMKSRTDGRFRVPSPEDLPGQFVNKGDVVAYVIKPGPVIARTVVTQADIDLVRNRTRSVEVLVSNNGLTSLPAKIKREVPGASEKLPSAALGTQGGGRIRVDPRRPDGLTAFKRIFQFDVALPSNYRVSNYGGRVFVRFYHGTEPLAIQVYWALRRVFLARFGS